MIAVLLLSLFITSFTICVSSRQSVHDHGSAFHPHQILRVDYQRVSLNCETRKSVVINGTVPGPTIHLPQGQRSWVRVFNDMKDQNLTMHWHGLTQDVAPFGDGSPQASQWPIPPGHFFDYEIRPGESRAGTYYYHSHVELQALTATGPLIIDDKNIPPYHYDGDIIIMLSDYFRVTDKVMYDGLTGNPFHWSGEVNNVLVNGMSRPSNSTASAEKCSIARINVEPGKVYRLRWIGGTGLSFIHAQIQAHPNLTVIEADGAYTQRKNVHYIQIGPGQRYSTLLKTKTVKELDEDRKNGITSYSIQLDTLERPSVMITYAVLHYVNHTKNVFKPPKAPWFANPQTSLSYLNDLAPLDPNTSLPPTSSVSRQIILNVFEIVRGNQTPEIIWTVNNHTPWTEFYPRVPYLVALYENASAFLPNYTYALQHGGFDPRVRAFPARIGEVLDIIIQNHAMGPGRLPKGPGSHPFHAHGTHYFNLGSGAGAYNATKNEARLQALGHSPATRDTTMLFSPVQDASLPKGSPAGWRAWRLVISDPGVWMIHCHTLMHMVMGMQSVWVFGTLEEVAPLPRGLIAEGYLVYSGTANGNASSPPKVLHWFD